MVYTDTFLTFSYFNRYRSNLSTASKFKICVLSDHACCKSISHI